MKVPLALLAALTLSTAPAVGAAEPSGPDGVAALLRRLERIVETSDTRAFLELHSKSANPSRALGFASLELPSGVGHAVIRERERAALADVPAASGYRLIVDAFMDLGSKARVATWRLDVERTHDPEGGGAWTILDERRLSLVEDLYRLSLDADRQFGAREFSLTSEDVELTLHEGTVFTASIDRGVAAAVFIGRGTVRFSPRPETERGQVKIFCGAETLVARFDAAFVRFNPADYAAAFSGGRLEPRPVDKNDRKRAEDLFQEDGPKAFGLDLGDLSSEPWSLVPRAGDFMAEIHTRRYDTLTYAKSGADAEDISLFDRKRKIHVALYPSEAKRALRARGDDEVDRADYDVLDYKIDLSVSPDRQALDGHARLRIRLKRPSLGSLTLRLADPLTIRSIVSDEFGRLFGVRVRDQGVVVVNVPANLPAESELTITFAYGGRLPPQTADRETASPQGRGSDSTAPMASELGPLYTPEPSFLYSSRTYWYPQATGNDYATATIRLSVPANLDCVASGELAPGFPFTIAAKDGSARKLYVFEATRPLRYLAFIVSRFTRTDVATIVSEPTSLKAAVEANPRQERHGRELMDRTIDIATFYESLVGDAPYPSFTFALIENDLPGGHSPAYFAALNQPLGSPTLVWRNDPVAFPNYPEFFAAHELAHQWWGHGVGWRSYHDQWLSEGFAQYFAALYAERRRGAEVFAGILHQFRHWAFDESEQGPVSLGYRLGLIRNQSRVFRALVYNKGAAVLHMLRRLVGDEAFFDGIQRFYWTWRFDAASTEDFRVAMEAASGRSLDRFFDGWIFGTKLAKVRFGYRVEPGEGAGVLVLRAEQIGEILEVPIVATIQYADRTTDTVVMAVTDRVAEMRLPLARAIRGVDVDKDQSLAEIVK